MKELISTRDKNYTNRDLIKSLQELGIKEGDILCVHTELFNFGKPLLSKDEFLKALLECFYKALGQRGTLIMPSFTYSFCKNEAFDKTHSKSTMGVLTEFFRKQKGVKRTNDPIFSFAIKGAKEELFLKDTSSCFGEGCVYDELAKNEGKILLFGMQNSGYTFTHFVEEKAGVSYRYFKKFSGILIDEAGKAYQKNIEYFVRSLEKNSNLSVEKQIELLKQDLNFKSLSFANASLTLINAKPYLQSFLKALKEDEEVLLQKEN
ncbi:acetyltransferase [Campylobacter sp. MIT 99-7217]|uniref:AAC(3) family N-acetyltransferase n=1 Tax=Campylobacter sp. MIT 99-7217 TaxID=535091 RepID=UPI001157A80C|nr:AAC(3) family N-acetyltransferase [Campylobacter sp. MIT 99-7217]TQR33832.1 acetyltransferase [Campylobacter sp. MIT 99-7217]